MKIGLLIGLIVAAIVAAMIVSSTMRGPRYRVQVCMYFNSRFNCKTVSAHSEDAAMRSAIQNACADIATGVTEVMNCESSTPRETKWLQRPKSATQ